jgi:hypothetical protein
MKDSRDEQIVKRFALILLAALPPAALVAAPPPRVVVQYELSYNGMTVGESKETLEHDGKTYRITSEARGKGPLSVFYRGSITRKSQGIVTSEGLRPLEYTEQRGDNTSRAKLDWTNKTLWQEKDGKSDTQPLPANAQDRLSFQWSFTFAPPKGKIVEAEVADGRGAPAHYRYEVGGTEVLKTPAGDIDTLHLVKLRDPDDKRGTEIWLAPKHDYLPVRVLVLDKDGSRIDTVVTHIEG